MKESTKKKIDSNVSRRTFLEKFVKLALPAIALTSLISIDATAKKVNDNEINANNTEKSVASGDCYGNSCTVSCSGGCTGCEGTCTASCTGCMARCQDTCYDNCHGGCKGDCFAVCRDGCQNSCGNNCSHNCATDCAGGNMS
jgi:hypothetical protein